MYKEVEYSPDLLKYWQAEKKSPKWYRDTTYTDQYDEASFQDFCKEHRLFELDDNVLLYTKNVTDTIVEIHLSSLKGANPQVKDFQRIRQQLFAEGTEIIFGWIFVRNYPLKRLCREIGLNFNGLVDKTGRATLECFAIDRRQRMLAGLI